MPLPTSQPTGGINPNLVIQPSAPVATAPNLMLLNEAFKQGLLTADDIKNRLTIKPLQDKVATAQAQDQLGQLAIAPARREQEMTAADQQNKLRDLQIQEGNYQIGDYPASLAARRKLSDLQIDKGTTENKYLDAKEQADVKDREAQAKMRDAQAAMLTMKYQPTPTQRALEQDHVNSILTKADELQNTVKGFSSGPLAGMGRSLSSNVPGTQMKDFQVNLDSLKAELKTYAASVKAAGATGSSGFKVTSQKEFDAIGGAIEGLDANMSPAALQAQLQKVTDHVLRIEKLKADEGILGAADTLAATAPKPAENLPVVDSQDAYDSLPPGTRYKDSHGNTAMKPGTTPQAPVQGPPPAPSAAPAAAPAVAQPPFRGAGAGSSWGGLPTSVNSPSPRASIAPHEALLGDLKNDVQRIKQALGLGN